MEKLIYELVKEYDNFNLWNVYINRPVDGNMRKVFLYRTTTLKNNSSNVQPVKKEKYRKRSDGLWIPEI